MSDLDLRPASAPAPRPKRVWRHALVETRLMLRNYEQLILALVIPLGLMIGGVLAGPRFGLAADSFIPSVIALGLWSSGFTAPAITTAFERRYGVLERLVATPLQRADLLAGKAAMIAMLAAGQGLVLSVTGLILGWRPQPVPLGILVTAAVVALALISFAGLALSLAGRASAELTLGLANLIYLIGAVAGLMVPLASFPGWTQPLLAGLPTTALAECLRDSAAGRVSLWPLLVVALWAAGSLLLARRSFRWTS